MQSAGDQMGMPSQIKDFLNYAFGSDSQGEAGVWEMEPWEYNAFSGSLLKQEILQRAAN